MVALAAFSLIHVPINIPAFAISTDVGKIGWFSCVKILYFLLTRQVLVLSIDADMNAELMAHGYSNAISGLFGGTFEQIF
jgi:SulP family sulfate permease